MAKYSSMVDSQPEGISKHALNSPMVVMLNEVKHLSCAGADASLHCSEPSTVMLNEVKHLAWPRQDSSLRSE